MDKKIMTKILATILAFTLTFANVALLGMYTQETLAASTTLEEQDKAVSKANIEFDAYFQREGEAVHSKDIDMATNQDTLYLSIKVLDGYLTNASIKIENANFSLVETQDDLELVQSINPETNTITLNQIAKGESAILEIPIQMNTDSNFDVQNISRISDVVLEGTYVNNKAKEIEISKTIEVSASLAANAEANLTEEVSKYVTFDVNGNKGVILQTVITSNIVGNIIPTKQTKLEIEIPNINNIAPETITLSSNSTKATNGQDGKVFVLNEDYTYENGVIILTIANTESEEGIISWLKDVTDEIILTCIYGEGAILPEADIILKTNSEITIYNNELTTISKSVSEAVTLNEQIGEIVTFDISANVSELNNGYMLVSGASNTLFVETISTNVGYSELVDSIKLNSYVNYIDENENSYPSESLYTYTKVSEENFLELLGEDGYINIYNKSGDLITTLNKDNLEYVYEEETTYINIETSKPISEGIIEIENGREITPLEYSKAQIEMFTEIEVKVNGQVAQNGQTIISGTDTEKIVLNKATSQAELTLSKQNISTVVTNEGVELRVTLKTTDSNTILYKNPVVEIVFPSYVTKISADNVRLLYEDELKLESAKLYTNEQGNKVIRVELSGEQTKFNTNALVEGATLIMSMDITVDEFTPSRTENIVMYVSNENVGYAIELGTPITFVAPSGLVTINQISGYNDKGDTATSISSKAEVGELDINSSAKTATMKMTVINNYSYNLKDVTLLGRTPFEGNKSIISGKDLGSTFTAEVVSKIKAETGVSDDQITVYYSGNGDATKDLSDGSNGWTTEIESLTEIKSFMIVLNDFTLDTGETVSFSYDIRIPEGLGYNEGTFGTFAVYYNIQEESETVASLSGNENITRILADVKSYLANSDDDTQEATEATAAGAETGDGPNLSVTLSANVENGTDIASGSGITYTAKVTNNSTKVAENVYLTFDVPMNSYYIDENGKYVSDTVTINVGAIPSGESAEVEFELKANGYFGDSSDDIEDDGSGPWVLDTTLGRDEFGSDEDYQVYLEAVEEYLAWKETMENINKITVSVTAKVEGYDDEFKSDVLTNNIVESDSDSANSSDTDLSLVAETNCSDNVYAGYEAEFVLHMAKLSGESLKNVVVTCVVPEGIEFSYASNDGVYDDNTRTVTWDFDEFSSQKDLILRCITGGLGDGVYEKNIVLTFQAICDEIEKTFISNSCTITIVADGITISQTSNLSNSYLYSGDEITYAITVKNLGSEDVSVQVTDYLPDGLTFKKVYYTQNGSTVSRTKNSGSAVKLSVTLSAGESLVIYVTASADKIAEDDTLEITNKVVLGTVEIDELWANELTHTIIGKNVDPGDIHTGDNSTPTHSISGTAWLDENEDGARETGEELLSGIAVYLLNSTTGEVVNNTTTSSTGAYSFTNLDSGKYIVAFAYDTLNYDLTIYQADEVNDDVNSDVVNMEFSFTGVSKKYGATDEILLNSDTYNIDLGLISSPKFDLELTKSVTLVQVSNSKGTSNYTFDYTDLAKVEIPGSYMKGSVVAITYTFTVTNAGAVAGYVNKIVDYMPSDLSFSSALNPEWYQDTNGNLYSTSLSGTILEPGESVEVSLILTKTMTDENTGIVNNTAEIYEASNDLGLADIDSTPANRGASEDDYGLADVIITVKTGGILIYGGIVLLVMGVFAVRSIYNKKESFNKSIRERRK